MERNSQTDLQWFIRELADLRRESTGRDGDVPRAYAKSPRSVYDPNRAEQIVEVSQRFAHSHEDNIVDLFAARAFHGNNLLNDLIRLQIAHEPFQTARAEFASISTTHLRRNADRAAVRSLAIKRRRRWNQDRFDEIRILQLKQKFLCRIFRPEHSDDVDLAEGKFLREVVAQAVW